MAGLTTAESQATLDARFPTTGGGDFIAYSIWVKREAPVRTTRVISGGRRDRRRVHPDRRHMTVLVTDLQAYLVFGGGVSAALLVLLWHVWKGERD